MIKQRENHNLKVKKVSEERKKVKKKKREKKKKKLINFYFSIMKEMFIFDSI